MVARGEPRSFHSRGCCRFPRPPPHSTATATASAEALGLRPRPSSARRAGSPEPPFTVFAQTLGTAPHRNRRPPSGESQAQIPGILFHRTRIFEFTMSMGSDMYRQQILDHYKNPRNYGELDDPTFSHVGENPMCGDEITVDIDLADDGETIERAAFHGDGCAISQ